MEAKINPTAAEVVALCSAFNAMRGPASYKQLRSAVFDRFTKRWPELTIGGGHDKPTERRDLTLSDREQRAIAEGLLALVNDSSTTGIDLQRCRELAAACRVKGWLDKQLEGLVDSVEGFTEPLDDEPPISDGAPAPSVAD